MKVLLAGGAGYIGTHTAVELIEKGHDIIIVDNYNNSLPEAINRVEKITNKPIEVFQTDIKDKDRFLKIMSSVKPDCVIHFAALKAVGESVRNPIGYYRNNIDTTLTILECMKECGVKNIVFSSSAVVYGDSDDIPYKEYIGRGHCSNPYGWTKYMMEQILEDAVKADKKLSVVILRYFNPIGAHESGMIGEEPKGVPNNLMPYITQVAVGRRDYLTIFGKDYPTKDGTCIRDYIHVMDLANGHVKAIEFCTQNEGVNIFNLGTGKPCSVLELVDTFEMANAIKIKYKFGERRAGDLPESWADVTKTKEILGWEATRTIADMCRDAWNWQKNNPAGYSVITKQ